MQFRTTVPLKDLGQLNPKWAGILSPSYDETLVGHYIHQQFLEDASVYSSRYQDTAAWKNLLQAAQAHFVISEPSPSILDIGSGSGNSVLPLLDLYPSASIVASDLSVPLLAILKAYLVEHYAHRKCILAQVNAEDICFADEQFDLVVGGSILHHLFEPQRCLHECCRVLKRGGFAVYFEPFELGNLVLSLVLRQLILANSCLPKHGVRLHEKVISFFQAFPPKRGVRLHEKIISFFEALCYDYEVRTESNKQLEIFKHMDDKWLFTEDYLKEAGRSAGFAEVEVFPINPDPARDDIFSAQVGTLLRVGCEGSGELPPWAIAMLQKLDRHFSPATRKQLIMEGCIVLKKR